MSSPVHDQICATGESLEQYALSTLSARDHSAIEKHLDSCTGCRREYDSIRSAIDSFADWPASELSPSPTLWGRLARRIGNEGWAAAEDELELTPQWPDLEWETPAPGIYCKMLSSDSATHRVSLLVRLDPGIEYPRHTHAGVEELHLLDGELWIDDRKLLPGDYNHAAPGSTDKRVWSQTGCTCVLITSADDQLR